MAAVYSDTVCRRPFTLVAAGLIPGWGPHLVRVWWHWWDVWLDEFWPWPWTCWAHAWVHRVWVAPPTLSSADSPIRWWTCRRDRVRVIRAADDFCSMRIRPSSCCIWGCSFRMANCRHCPMRPDGTNRELHLDCQTMGSNCFRRMSCRATANDGFLGHSRINHWWWVWRVRHWIDDGDGGRHAITRTYRTLGTYFNVSIWNLYGFDTATPFSICTDGT